MPAPRAWAVAAALALNAALVAAIVHVVAPTSHRKQMLPLETELLKPVVQRPSSVPTAAAVPLAPEPPAPKAAQKPKPVRESKSPDKHALSHKSRRVHKQKAHKSSHETRPREPLPPVSTLSPQPEPGPPPDTPPASALVPPKAAPAAIPSPPAPSTSVPRPAPPTHTAVSISASYAASNSPPPYPPMSRLNEEQGTVVLRVLVRPDGTAGKVEIRSSSGYPLLDHSAQETVRRWHFNPATEDGRPVAEWYRLPVRFKLPDD